MMMSSPMGSRVLQSALSHRSYKGEVRTLDQFMEDQLKYEQRRFENLKQAIIKEESEDIQRYKPAINKKSVEILEKKKGTADEDEWVLRQKKQEQMLKKRMEEEGCSFKPRINPKSKNIKRGLIPLVEDVNRRREAKESLQKILSEKQSMESSRAFINSNSDKFMYKKFDQEFERACISLGIADKEDGFRLSKP